MLRNPFEEQFHLPVALVKSADGQCGQLKIVGQKHQRLAQFRVFEANAPQMRRVILRRLRIFDLARVTNMARA